MLGRSSKTDARVRVEHVRESITAIASYVSGFDAAALDADSRTYDAVLRRLEIICEATKALIRLMPEVTERHPGIPWRDITAMRDKLAHDYDAIGPAIVWNTVTRELGPLADAMADIAAWLEADPLA